MGDVNKKQDVSIINYYIGWDNISPILFSNAYSISYFFDDGCGISKLKLENKIFNQLDNITLTELRDENNEWQFGNYLGFGIMLSVLKHLSIQYSYSLTQVEKNFKYLHLITNSIVFLSLSNGFSLITSSLNKESKNTILFKILNFIYKSAVYYEWQKFSYNHHNWPFHDPAPLQYRRKFLTFRIIF